VDKPEPRRGSEVLDAILDKVAEDTRSSVPTNVLFRAKALEQLDVATEVDARLPLVSRRSWLALVGVGLLVAAFALWASLTPSVTSVNVQARVVAVPGALPVATTVDGLVESVATGPKTVVPGDTIATLTTAGGSSEVRGTVAGTVWQQLVVPGSTVLVGDPVITVLPADSANQALFAVPQAEAAAMAKGMPVLLGNGTSGGLIDSISAPVTADQASARIGLTLPDDTTYAMVSVALNTPMVPGTATSATVVLSEGTVLTRLLGRT
jgi:HlyD family secretion protein